jgi:predicted O-methyltransferase YrrM
VQILSLAYHFLLYRFRSFRLHGVHSPFVFDLYEHVIRHDGQYFSYPQIEALRKQLLKNEKVIQVTDLGAGSRTGATSTRQIRAIAATAAKPAKYAQLLFRLVNHFQPRTVLELGTSLGLTTAYLAMGRRQSQVITFEGCPNLAAEASRSFRQLRLHNIRQVTGHLDDTLPATLQALPAVDMVYFDGNHRYEPTMRYFEACLAKRTEDSVFVIDDIYWSPEMVRAWRSICRHPEVTLSIDLFQLGLIFFRRKQPKQHFNLWY